MSSEKFITDVKSIDILKDNLGEKIRSSSEYTGLKQI